MSTTSEDSKTQPSAPRGAGSLLLGLPGVLAATLLTQGIGAWAVLALAAIAPTVAEAFDLPPVLVGYQITIIYFVATGTSLIAGGLVSRWGPCRISQVSLLCCALGCAIVVLPALPAIAVASVAIGFSYGLTNPSAAHILARYTTTRNRSFVFSIKQTGVPIGGIAAGLLTPWIAVNWGWQPAVAVIVPVALLLAVILSPARETWDCDRRGDAPIGLGALRGAGRVFAQPALRWLCFCGFCFGAIQLCLMTFVVSLAVTELDFGAVLAGSLLATVQVFGVAGRLSWGLVADRLQRNALVLAIVGLITAACCLGFSQLDGDSPRWLAFAIAAVFGASAVGWNGVFLSEVVRLTPPSMVGTSTGVATFCTFSGVLVGPAIFVQLYGWIDSYAATYALLIAPALIGGAAGLLTLRYSRRSAEVGA